MQSYFVCIPFFFMITAELRSMKAKVSLIWKIWVMETVAWMIITLERECTVFILKSMYTSQIEYEQPHMLML